MSKIKILHVIPVFATGGAERLVLEYAKFFDPEKYEIHVASCVDDGELRQKFEALKNVRVMVCKRSEGGRMVRYKKLANYVSEIKPDIIHTHLISADLFGYGIKRKYKDQIKWVSTMHNVESATSTWRQMLWKFILPKSDRVISVSERVEEFTLDTFKISKEKSIVLRNGIESDKWLTIPMAGLLKDQTIRIASIGRLWEQKGHTYLLQALPLLQDIPYEVHMFGDGPLRDKLETEARIQGVAEKVIWHGVQSDIPRYMRNIDIVVQPSLWEGLSLVVMEMMAAGRVVITTPAGGDELIQDGITGYVIPYKNPHAIAEKIREVSEDKKTAIQCGRAARVYAKEQFDISKNIYELEKIYTNLLT